MSYFLTSEKLAKGKRFEVINEEAKHLVESLHAKVGEKFIFQDAAKKRFRVLVVEVTRHSLTCEVIETLPEGETKKTKINILQALIAEKALDFLIQKGTELGAAKIVIFPSKNSYIKKIENVEHKLARWQKISLEATKQSERVEPLKVEIAKDLEEALTYLDDTHTVILSDKKGGKLDPKKLGNEISCLIGPEGGFNKEEMERIEKLTTLKLKLSCNILRAETAGLATISVLEYLTD